MKITDIKLQTRDKNRVNVSVDGKYRFSLHSYQLVELGIKIGREYDEAELIALEQESQFGKVYGRALEYCLMRPHSSREVKDYLYRKTRSMRIKTGELKPGVSPEIMSRVFERLIDKNYIDDTKFAKYWVENHSLAKGSSFRKLTIELRAKGINDEIIQQVMAGTERSDREEIQKIITKKRAHYPDEQKLTMYLARLGFAYSDIKQALSELK
ncbi:MAG TPA: RecX family transcriptional regulator [Candidatus Angelobacter sp.]|nr:RecX family transcriptional regulator [Candidatus Angelobacter sp.]